MSGDTGRSSGNAASSLLLGSMAVAGLGASYYLNRKKINQYIEIFFSKARNCFDDKKQRSANCKDAPKEQQRKQEEKREENVVADSVGSSTGSSTDLLAHTKDGQLDQQRAVEHSVALSKLANKHYANKEHSKAISLLSQAIALYDNYKYYTNRALIYIHEKEYQKAHDDSLYSVSLKQTPKGYYALGRSAMGLKRFQEAINHFDVIEQFSDEEAKDSKRLAAKLSMDCSVKLAKQLKRAEGMKSSMLHSPQTANGSDLNLSLELPAPNNSFASADSPVTDEAHADEDDYDMSATSSTSLNTSKMTDSFYRSGVLVEHPGQNES